MTYKQEKINDASNKSCYTVGRMRKNTHKKTQIVLPNVSVGKLVHGGQAIGEISQTTADAVGMSSLAGRKIFVWNALPGELVDVRVTKKKSSYLEGIAATIHITSPDRAEPVEPQSYLSTSPWQMMEWEAENTAKQSILAEVFGREGINDINFDAFVSGDQQSGYRNKQEIGFWGDDDGLHLAHYVRGTHGKQIVESSIIAAAAINTAQVAILGELRKHDVWAGDLKTVVVRCNAAGDTVTALFCKKELDLSKFTLPSVVKGMDIYFSNPLSPASVPTKKLYSFGDTTLVDTIAGKRIGYGVLSFFQVNIPVFEQVLATIKKHVANAPSVDMYSGVGSIGIAVGSEVLVELEKENVAMAKQNAKGTKIKIVHATAEAALEHISSDRVLIVDPPRAGLHKDVIDAILDKKPPKAIYLSCNPSTQARDVRYLSDLYKVSYAQGYNFFPRTPHIESLIVLETK